MRYIFILFLFNSCTTTSSKIEDKNTLWSSVEVKNIYSDSISIRAIELYNNQVAFGANNGQYGIIQLETDSVFVNTINQGDLVPEFRSIAYSGKNLFLLSVGSPALLYKINADHNMELVYTEEGDNVFYDSMRFWNEREGIAIGDRVGECLSIIITRDGGNSWNKILCDKLPVATEKEGAFAASNTNIDMKGDKAWVATTNSRIYYSSDKGATWSINETPIIKDKDTQGIYSIDFYDEKIGIAIGGDYTNPDANTSNKAMTFDGGLSWSLIADGSLPNYKSCIQFVPNTNGQKLVAVGFNGIVYSNNQGNDWTKLSDESFYTIRFTSHDSAIAAGKNRIAKLNFK